MTFRFLLETPPLPPPGGPVKRRVAVRALVVRNKNLLLVRSATVGDWKFPGGGVEPRETQEQALEREIAEETGYACRGRFRRAGTVVERAPGREVTGSLFVMESHYFWATVEDSPGTPKLEGYEQALGFTPGWVTVAQALEDNRKVALGAHRPAWLERETKVLEWLSQNLAAVSSYEF